jgi:hypothetical protein
MSDKDMKLTVYGTVDTERVHDVQSTAHTLLAQLLNGGAYASVEEVEETDPFVPYMDAKNDIGLTLFIEAWLLTKECRESIRAHAKAHSVPSNGKYHIFNYYTFLSVPVLDESIIEKVMRLHPALISVTE